MTTNCKSELSSQNTLIETSLTSSEDRKRTGRYVAGGTALAVTLLALHHVLMRGGSSSNLAGIFVPAVIMTIYVIWVLYSARRDSRKAALKASGIELVSITAKGEENENISAAQIINKVNKVNKLTTIDELKK